MHEHTMWSCSVRREARAERIEWQNREIIIFGESFQSARTVEKSNGSYRKWFAMYKTHNGIITASVCTVRIPNEEH